MLDHLEKNKIDNTLILTGDIHQVPLSLAGLSPSNTNAGDLSVLLTLTALGYIIKVCAIHVRLCL